MRLKKGLRSNDLDRPVMIHVCKDGTVTYRTRDQKVFNGKALPVFSVDTVQQAESIQVHFCNLQYVEHPQMPGKPWYRWTAFPGTLEALDDVTSKMREFYETRLLAKVPA